LPQAETQILRLPRRAGKDRWVQEQVVGVGRRLLAPVAAPIRGTDVQAHRFRDRRKLRKVELVAAAKQSSTMQKSLAHPVTEMRQTLQIFAYPWLAPRVMTELLLAD
jgi:hypothetical protein